jgi:hypothetical protein
MRSQHLVFLVALLSTCGLAEKAPLSCSASEQEPDPALKEMTFDIGDGPETFLAYVQPHVTTFYKDIDPPASKPVRPKHNGFAGMFVNMSNKRVRLYWYVCLCALKLGNTSPITNLTLPTLAKPLHTAYTIPPHSTSYHACMKGTLCRWGACSN